MLPQIRQIHKLVVEEQDAQVERVAEEGLVKGVDTEVDANAEGCEHNKVCEYRQTGQLQGLGELKQRGIDCVKGAHRLSPHLLRHVQWKVWEHGTVMRPVMAESMRSRHTGHVGSSYVELCGEPNRDMA